MSAHLNLRRRGRHALRQVRDAVRYVCRTGCQWRCLPARFPPWPGVYYCFSRWQADGMWERLSQASTRADRLARQRLPTPSLALALADAQRVSLAPPLREQRGLGAHKFVNGRKCQLLCGTGGRIWRATLHAANGHDSRTARLPARNCARLGLPGYALP